MVSKKLTLRWVKTPYLTALLVVSLLVGYVVEQHPQPAVPIGAYLVSVFSVYTPSQLGVEIVLVCIGGIPGEQFASRAKLLAFALAVGPFAVWLAEWTHPGTLVLGMSGASMGLIGFSTLATVWYLVDRPESHLLFIGLSVFLAFAAVEVADAFYGYFIHAPVVSQPTPLRIYKPHTMYVAHVAAVGIGAAWWLIRHYTSAVLAALDAHVDDRWLETLA